MLRHFIGPSPECLIRTSLSVYTSFVNLFSNVMSLFSEKKQKRCFVMGKKMQKDAMKDACFLTQNLSLHNILLSLHNILLSLHNILLSLHNIFCSLHNIFCSLHNIFMTMVRSSASAATSAKALRRRAPTSLVQITFYIYRNLRCRDVYRAEPRFSCAFAPRSSPPFCVCVRESYCVRALSI